MQALFVAWRYAMAAVCGTPSGVPVLSFRSANPHIAATLFVSRRMAAVEQTKDGNLDEQLNSA